VSVFYEIWNRPLYTVNGEHLISDVIRMCGGRNVFAELAVLAPTVSVEAVLKANPDAIVASGMGGARPEWLDEWKSWPDLSAARLGNLFAIDSDLMNRHGTRIAEGARRLCEMLDSARSKKR
jgi:iron complex transport system substrate-binding protein